MGAMGMGGMMGGNQVPDLKELGPEGHVSGVTYCKDTYIVTTADGHSRKFWECNLRLMTDASARVPPECSGHSWSRHDGRPCGRDLCESKRD